MAQIYEHITSTSTNIDLVSRAEVKRLEEELKSLKTEMKELKKLLKAAKVFDDATDQHDCEMDDKVELIKTLAKLVGVDLSEVFGKDQI